MQQAIIADTVATPESGNLLPPNAVQTPFVINLCASTTPVALSQPRPPELRRFTFFVSRRREEGRERFRLHMGYFRTQEEAEQLLEVVREIYPAAWAGVAPGQRLRVAAATSTPVVAPAPVVLEMAAPTPVFEIPAPVLQMPEPAATVAAITPEAPAADASALRHVSALSLMPDDGRGSSTEKDSATSALTNVRAAIAALEDDGGPAAAASIDRQRPVPVAAPVLHPIPELKAASTAAPPPAARTMNKSAVLTEKEALRVLEQGATARASKHAAKVPAAKVSAAKSTPPGTDAAGYAVQLLWSVQPIDHARVPQLAIFAAYTLYGAEGNRGGRRWYGLRLGFFTDAVSAKQVAAYVRSEFETVSIVPVTQRERERAKLATTRPGATPPVVAEAATAGAAAAGRSGEFKLIEDNAAVAPQPMAAARMMRGAPGKRAKLRTPAQKGGIAPARAKAKPMTLEETLEILGAGQLQMDDGREATINDSGVHHLQLEPVKQRASKFGRLIERLSERLGQG
ncbi:MAG: hypothetical protein ACHQAR_02370 [Steroidobacterales bacterium]